MTHRERRIAALVERLRASDSATVDALVDEASYMPDPGVTLARVFGCSRQRKDSLHKRNLWLFELSRCSQFAGLKVTHQADALEQFLTAYQRTQWPHDRGAASCPYQPGADACAWHIWRAHADVGPDRREISGPPARQTIYALLKRISNSTMDVKTALPDAAASDRPKLKANP